MHWERLTQRPSFIGWVGGAQEYYICIYDERRNISSRNSNVADCAFTWNSVIYYNLKQTHLPHQSSSKSLVLGHPLTFRAIFPLQANNITIGHWLFSETCGDRISLTMMVTPKHCKVQNLCTTVSHCWSQDRERVLHGLLTQFFGIHTRVSMCIVRSCYESTQFRLLINQKQEWESN